MIVYPIPKVLIRSIGHPGLPIETSVAEEYWRVSWPVLNDPVDVMIQLIEAQLIETS